MSPHKLRNKSPDRYHRPGGHTGYKPNAPTPQESIQPDFLNKVTGIDPEEEKAMEDRAHSGAAEDTNKNSGLSSDQLEAAEQKGGAANTTGAEQDESGSPGLYKGDGDGKTKGKGRLTRRQKIFGGAAGGLMISGIFLGFTFFSGPGQFLHFAQLLQRFHFITDEEFMNGRTGKLIRYARTANSPEKRNMGFWGNKLADRYETKLRKAGIEADYGGTKRIQALSIDPDTPEGRQALGDIQSRGVEIPDPEPTPDGGRRVRIDLDGSSARVRRQVLGGMVESIKLGKISSTIGKRVLRVRAAVDFHPLKNITRALDEDFFKYVKRVKEKRKAQRSRGVDTTARSTDAETDADGDGEETDGDKAARDAADQGREVTDGLDGNSSTPEISARSAEIKGKLAKGAGIAGTVALTCGIYKLGESLPQIQYQNIILPLLRIGMDIIAIGSQIMSPLQIAKDVNVNELGVIAQDFYNEDDGTSWASARSIQAELGQEQTGPDMPNSSKPGRDAKPVFFDIVSNIIEGVPGGPTACNAVTSKAGGWIIDGAGWAFSATGPAGFIGNAIVDLAIGAATGAFVDDLVRWLVNGQVANDAAGALLGNYANYGALLAANDTSISHGGSALSSQQTAALDAERKHLLNAEFQRKPLLARYFDLNEPRSLAAKLLYENPRFSERPQTMLASLFNSPMTVLPALAGPLQSKAHAQQGSYDYGFPEYGFSLEDQEDDRVEDPYANAAIVEPKLTDLNNKYGDCFSMKIDPATGKMQSGPAKRYDEIDEKAECNDGSEDLLRYRFYLADMATEKSLTCYEGIDESACEELGFSNETPASDSTTQAGGEIVGDIGEHSDNVKCAPGTTDLGVVESKYTGSAKKTSDPLRIRLCQIPDIDGYGDNTEGVSISGGAVVNSRVSGAWLSLAKDAKLDKTPLTAGSSFRYADSCGGGGDGGACATPGSSYHQLGIAIDFADIDGINTSAQSCDVRVTDPDSPSWVWLRNNAERYGFKQYSAEAWHWDAANTANRCGSS